MEFYPIYDSKKRGQWLDCSLCRNSYREILPHDLEKYVDSEGNTLVLDSSILRKCYTCNPLIVHHKFVCDSCGVENILPMNYHSEANPTKCVHCEYDSDKPYTGKAIFAHTGINGRDWQKGLSSDYKDMMKNFKKRHNNGNNSIPEY